MEGMATVSHSLIIIPHQLHIATHAHDASIGLVAFELAIVFALLDIRS
jgi:hypothetical protein